MKHYSVKPRTETTRINWKFQLTLNDFCPCLPNGKHLHSQTLPYGKRNQRTNKKWKKKNDPIITDTPHNTISPTFTPLDIGFQVPRL